MSAIIILFGMAGAWRIARMGNRRFRLMLLGALLATPPLVYTLIMLVPPASEHGSSLEWWVIGLAMIAPPYILYIVACLGAYAASRGGPPASRL